MTENEGGGVEILEGFATVRAGAGVDRWSAASYARGISFSSVGSRTLSMNVATLPAGGRIEPHIHDGYEVGLYVLAGRLEHRFGPRLEHSVTNGAGDFI